MRKQLLIVLIVVAVGVLSGVSAAARAGTPAKSVALLISGNLGDGGFWDESQAGVAPTAGKLGLKEKTVQTGYDPTTWGPALNDLASQNYDVIFAGSFSMEQLVEQAAKANPSKDFVLFDQAFSAKACGYCKNIYSIVYRYKQTGFLAGALGALMLDAHLPGLKNQRALGFVGGQDIPVIEEYKSGWEAGAHYVDKRIKLISSFAGSFSDPVKGSQLGAQEIAAGAGILFTASGDTDKGVLEAAATGHTYAIGNSKLQAAAPVINGKTTVVTSSVTSVTSSLASAVTQAAKGTLPVGTVKAFGVKEGAIFLEKTPTYLKLVPAKIRQRMAKITGLIRAGKLDA